VRTDQKGLYSFFTLVPASYPNSNNPRHIHAIIKEPGKSEYWIDEFLFADDPLLPPAEKARPQPVGGHGVLTTVLKDGLLEARRDIILGLNVRNYPLK
jgi:protocatechuate 3,4-dioxygenase beta subunit